MKRIAFTSLVGSFLSLSITAAFLGGCAAPTSQDEEMARTENNIEKENDSTSASDSDNEAPAASARTPENDDAVLEYIVGGPLMPGDLVSLQRALCVPESEVGQTGPRTPVAIRIFKDSIGTHATNDPRGRVEMPNEYSVAVTWSACNRSKYANFFEARYVDRPSDVQMVARAIQEDVYGIDASPSLPTKLSAIRQDIAKANKFYNIDLKGAREDEVTPALFRKLKIAISPIFQNP